MSFGKALFAPIQSKSSCFYADMIEVFFILSGKDVFQQKS